MELENTPIDCETDTWQPLAKAAEGLLDRLRANADDEQAKKFQDMQATNTNAGRARSDTARRRAG